MTDDFPQGPGINRKFRRSNLRRGLVIDGDGFVDCSCPAMSFADLLSADTRAVLIRGRPWLGKSYLFEAIRGQQAELKLGDFVWDTQLQDYSARSKLLPNDWETWKSSDTNACWLVDSLDEGELVEPNLWSAIVEQVELLDVGCRNRLQVIVFSRSEPFLDRFASKMTKLFDKGFVDVDLLEWQRDDARQRVGNEQVFSETVAAIQKYGLQKVSALPAAFEYIKENRNQSLSVKEVWKGVLKELLREKSTTPLRLKAVTEQVEDRFNAAARIAAVMTFAGIEEVCVGDVTGIRRVDDLINLTDESSRRLRKAAKESLQELMFRNGQRFAQQHLREWMCAFALENVPLTRLKPLVTNEDGKIAARHYELLSLLTIVSKFDTEIDQWLMEQRGGVPLRSDSNPYSPLEAQLILDRLGDLADQASESLHIWGDKGLENLKVTGIGRELANRLLDPSRSEKQKIMLLEVAIETDSNEVVSNAANILQDRKAGDELRQRATACVCNLANDEELAALDSFCTSSGRSRIDKYIRAVLIYHLLYRQLWDVAVVARHAMKLIPNDEVLDVPHTLFYRLEKELNLAAAREVISFEVKQLKQRRISGERRTQIRHDLLNTALNLITESPEATSADCEVLVPLALAGWDDNFLSSFNFVPAIRKSQAARRLYIMEGHKLLATGRKSPLGALHWFLSPEDAEWLIEHALEFSKASKDFWIDLYHLSCWVDFDSYRTALRGQIERHSPRLIATMDQRMVQAQIENEQRERDREKRFKKPKTIPLIDAVNKVLESEKLSLQEKFWRLARFCFGQDQWRPRDLTGQWADLPDAARQAVMTLCREALSCCEPTPVPDGNSFPSLLLYESWAFSAVMRQSGVQFELTEELIRKWLPCSYFMWHESWDGVVFRCHEISPTATEDVVVAEARRELRSKTEGTNSAVGNYSHQFWTPRFANSLREIVLDNQYGEDGRAYVLKKLTQNVPKVALPILKTLIRLDSHGRLWTKTLDCLFRLEPDSAWEWLEPEFERRGKSLFSELRCFYTDHQPIGFDSPEWTRERLIKLARMLLKSFPEERDLRKVSIVTEASEYANVRWHIISFLFQRNQPSDRESVNELAEEYPVLKPWIERHLLHEATSAALQASPYLPFEEVRQLLENADFHIIRNSADLLVAVVDCLKRIGEQTGRFIEMLYLPDEKSVKERRRHESALQAYVECRLHDMLPGRFADEKTTVQTHREPQGHFRNRTDVFVTAPTITKGVAEVVVEIKWSDNRDARHGKVCNALTKQLGEIYLVKEQRTHGIYLVGWIGNNVSWSSTAGPKPKTPHTVDSLEEAFRKQAMEFEKQHPTITIAPIVWNLQWPN